MPRIEAGLACVAGVVACSAPSAPTPLVTEVRQAEITRASIDVEGAAPAAGFVDQFYYSDYLGSTVAVTDKTGAVTCREEYQPWGEEHSVTGECGDRKYNGRILDEETGLYYYDARYYDPLTARFISADWSMGTPLNPQSGNRYAYVLNNPYKFVDPSGNDPAQAFYFMNAVNHYSAKADAKIHTAGNFAAGFVRGFVGVNLVDNNDDYMSVAYGNGEIAGASVGLATAVFGAAGAVKGLVAPAARVAPKYTYEIAKAGEQWANNAGALGSGLFAIGSCRSAALKNAISGLMNGYGIKIIHLWDDVAGKGHAVTALTHKMFGTKYLSWGKVFNSLDEIAAPKSRWRVTETFDRVDDYVRTNLRRGWEFYSKKHPPPAQKP